MAEALIVDWIRESLERGSLHEGEQLPSENILAARFGVSRSTVRAAYSQLEDMGLVQAKQGQGRFFRGFGQVVPLSLDGDESFSTKVRKSGRTLENRLIAAFRVPGEQEIRRRLGIDTEQSLFCLRRRRIIDGHPMAIHTSFLSENQFPDIQEQAREMDSLFAYFHSHGFHQLFSSRSELSVKLPSLEEQELLGCPALVPLLEIESDTFDVSRALPLQVTRITYRGDRFRYVL